MDLSFVSLLFRLMTHAALFSISSDFRSPKERTASGYESDAITDIGQLRRGPGGPRPHPPGQGPDDRAHAQSRSDAGSAGTGRRHERRLRNEQG